MSTGPSLITRTAPGLWQKLGDLPWLLVIMLCALTAVGAAMLYSAADGNMAPWSNRHTVRFAACLGGALVIALIDIRLWFRYAYVLYGAALVLLIAVEVAGSVGMGAQRWINLGVMKLQPSELMKVALVLGLARCFHGLSAETVRKPLLLVMPVLLVTVPAVFVLKQPDLGTTVMLVAAGAMMFFAAGVPLWLFGLGSGAAMAVLPVAWQFLHDYQRQRVLTFLDPSIDPLGSGYHITQSKIALGSGGLFGKGFLHGTQSHLNFLPEKQTDFIFTMYAEEFGLVGTLALLGLYTAVIVYGVVVAVTTRHHFGRLLAIGVTSTFFLYACINMAMVMGLIPVVGVPLPLISYGGSAMLSVMVGFGLLMCVSVHRHVVLRRQSLGE
ncbi:MAG: rod shape-determining protein RodA [Hyphomicrobiales bacterium]|nr:rod shape-determining protein RodA [Hyphomicrobiales bacterium]